VNKDENEHKFLRAKADSYRDSVRLSVCPSITWGGPVKNGAS